MRGDEEDVAKEAQGKREGYGRALRTKEGS